MKKAFFFVFLFILFPFAAGAEALINVSPNIIDEKVKIRDIKKYTIIVTNTSDRAVDIYPLVNNYSQNNGLEEFLEPGAADRSVSLANWISLRRGVIELNVGEKKQVPLEIKVDPSAVPGIRHAVVAFPVGSNRKLAEEGMPKSETAKLYINFEVEEEIVENAQIEIFETEKNIFFSLPINFNLKIKNFGNKEIVPTGEIYIYNRQGQEIESMDINTDKTPILPDESGILNRVWDKDIALGKYKARLIAEYGIGEERDLQDTIYFWFLPLKFLIIFSVSLFILMILIIIILFKKTYHHHPGYYGQANNSHSASGIVLDLKKATKNEKRK